MFRIFTASTVQPGMNPAALQRVQQTVNRKITRVLIERQWHIEFDDGYTPNARDIDTMRWLFSEPGQKTAISHGSLIRGRSAQILEVRPRLGVETPLGDRAKQALTANGIPHVRRVEMFTRYGINIRLTAREAYAFLSPVHDRMSEEENTTPVTTFTAPRPATMFRFIPVLEQGIDALLVFQAQYGLPWSHAEMEELVELFTDRGVNPTDLALFQYAAVMCDHSRHPFFRQRHFLDGERMPESLFDIVKAPWKKNPGVSVLAFCDDSSASRGAYVRMLLPDKSGRFVEEFVFLHLTATAETHNHPCLNAPYQGALTCIGGWIRDLMCAGMGSLIGSAGYGLCVGPLRIPNYELPWEEEWLQIPEVYANPLAIALEASRGMADYGNCFGIPTNLTKFGSVGFWVRSRDAEGKVTKRYVSCMKPIVFGTGGGHMHAEHVPTNPPSVGELVYLIGPPARRVGVGGGPASSKPADPTHASLDFASVQRGDASDEQTIWRVVLGCTMQEYNIIRAMGDLGAGGCSNALTEIMEAKVSGYKGGGVIYINRIPVADPTMMWMEVWVCESQERIVIRILARDRETFEAICKREGCVFAQVGEVTGSGRIEVIDEADPETKLVDLDLDRMLKDLPESTTVLMREERVLEPLTIPEELSFRSVLMDRLLRLFGVASNNFFVKHVDHTVGGRTAAFQDAGPAQIPIRHYSVDVLSALDLVGSAKSIGEAMLVGLLDPKAMARMALGRSALGLLGVLTDALETVRFEANWMFAKSGPGDGARLVDAARALRDAMLILKVAIDGGKDSGSMTVHGARNPNDGSLHIVHAPLQLMLTAYVKVPNVTRQVGPDLKVTGNTLIHVDVARGNRRLGGTAFAQVLGQLGNECPDADMREVKKVFRAVQSLVAQRRVVAVQNFDGEGLAVTAIKMAMAGKRGLRLATREDGCSAFETLMNGELGVILETHQPRKVMQKLWRAGIVCSVVGHVGNVDQNVSISHNGEVVLLESLAHLRNKWEETSLELEQADPERGTTERCISHARLASADSGIQKWKLTYTPRLVLPRGRLPKAAVLREKSTNGDDEMRTSLMLSGFDVYDVHMSDLLAGRYHLSQFQLIVFPGGFSFGDVLGAGKVWAGEILHNALLRDMFQEFHARPDTLVLGVCNGCQVMSQLGWMPKVTIGGEEKSFEMAQNASGRFESRVVTLRVEEAARKSVFLRAMWGSTLGAIVANGEGRFSADQAVFEEVEAMGGIALTFADLAGEPTMRYPYNPSGSPRAVAGVISRNGQDLAMMPHFERTVAGRVYHRAGRMDWQHLWPWLPTNFRRFKVSPWLQLGQSAHDWCVQHQ